MVPFERFARMFRYGFELNPEAELNEGTVLVDDLAFDSFELFKVSLFVEEVAGVEEPDIDYPPIPETLGDVYRMYAALVKRPPEV